MGGASLSLFLNGEGECWRGHGGRGPDKSALGATFSPWMGSQPPLCSEDCWGILGQPQASLSQHNLLQGAVVRTRLERREPCVCCPVLLVGKAG